MMQRLYGSRSAMWIGGAGLLLALSAGGCIDVGHEAEIGCKVDMTEPGCTAKGGSNSTGTKGGAAGKTSSVAGASSSRAGAPVIAGAASFSGNAGSAASAGSAGSSAGNVSMAGETSVGLAGRSS